MKTPGDFAGELYQAGRAAMEAGKLETAANLFRASARLEPHFKTLELLGELLLESQGATTETILVLSSAAGLGNRPFRSLFLLAKALALRGDISHAIEKLDLAIEYQPSFKSAIEFRDELKARQAGSPPT
jgi:tetratricopeptide (TPR) repeat protein